MQMNKAQYTIGNFCKKFHQKSSAQGTIEYLVILAVVVVIGLVVVSLSTGFFDNASSIATTSGNIDRITASGIVVSEAIADYQGNSLIALKNTSPDTLTIKEISSNEYDETLTQGSEILLKLENLQNICTCEPGQTTKNCELEFYYTTRHGLEQKITQTITLECIATIPLDSGVPPRPPQAPPRN